MTELAMAGKMAPSPPIETRRDEVESRLDRPLARRQARENMPLERLQHPVEREEKSPHHLPVGLWCHLRMRSGGVTNSSRQAAPPGLRPPAHGGDHQEAARSPCATSRRSARY